MLLQIRDIRKRFGGAVALDGVSFDLAAGEIHALLGENGAGKSTLIKILGGVHAPDSGEIHIDDAPVAIRDVGDATRLGIRLIHQELALAPNLTVAENLFLGREPAWHGLLLKRRLFEEAGALIADLGFHEIQDVGVRVSDLSVARQQLVEIARALSQQARILVLDEPTAALSEVETAALFERLQKLRSQGVGMIYISHRLDEIGRLADRVTVLRDGKSIGTQKAGGIQRAQLVQWMVGRELKHHYPRPTSRPGAVVLRVRDLRGPHVAGVSFELRAGEILGLAGLVGAGRTELARVLFGLEPATSGEIQIDGKPVLIANPASALAAGIVMVPEDRKREGLVMGQSVAFNATLPWTREWVRGCFVNHRRRREICESVIQRFQIKAASLEQPVHALSGGNQQKLLVGRWTEHPPRVLILDEPTRGVDVGAREDMFRMIHTLAAQGMGVLLISSDLPEVLHLSHRVLLYPNGHIVGERDAAGVSQEEVMAVLSGAGEPIAVGSNTEFAP